MSIRKVTGVLLMGIGLIWLVVNLIRGRRHRAERDTIGLKERVARLEERVQQMEGRLDILLPLMIMLIGAVISGF